MVLSMSACSDDEPAEMVEAESQTEEAPLPVRQWYPRQKQSAPSPQYSQPQFQYNQPQPQPQYSQPQQQAQPQYSQPQMMQLPAYSTQQPAQQQDWAGGYQVYQAPPVIIVQPQTPWYGSSGASQQTAQPTVTPQQYVNPYSYQLPQRPWGETPQTTQNKQQTYTAPPGGNQQVNPWSGWQAPVTPGYPGWGTPYGGYPGTPTPGYVW